MISIVRCAHPNRKACHQTPELERRELPSNRYLRAHIPVRQLNLLIDDSVEFVLIILSVPVPILRCVISGWTEDMTSIPNMVLAPSLQTCEYPLRFGRP